MSIIKVSDAAASCLDKIMQLRDLQRGIQDDAKIILISLNEQGYRVLRDSRWENESYEATVRIVLGEQNLCSATSENWIEALCLAVGEMRENNESEICSSL